MVDMSRWPLYFENDPYFLLLNRFSCVLYEFTDFYVYCMHALFVRNMIKINSSFLNEFITFDYIIIETWKCWVHCSIFCKPEYFIVFQQKWSGLGFREDMLKWYIALPVLPIMRCNLLPKKLKKASISSPARVTSKTTGPSFFYDCSGYQSIREDVTYTA